CPHDLLEGGVDPVARQGGSDGGGVAVDDLAEQQFGADRHDLDDHATTLASQSVPAVPTMRAVTQAPGVPRSSRATPSISGAWCSSRPTGTPSSTWSTRPRTAD